jgi:hypothetical protein
VGVVIRQADYIQLLSVVEITQRVDIMDIHSLVVDLIIQQVDITDIHSLVVVTIIKHL